MFNTPHPARPTPVRRRGGRPPTLGATESVGVRLTHAEVTTLRRLGNGSISEGLRELLRRYAADDAGGPSAA